MDLFQALCVYAVINLAASMYHLTLMKKHRPSGSAVARQIITHLTIVVMMGWLHVSLVYVMTGVCLALVPFQAALVRRLELKR